MSSSAPLAWDNFWGAVSCCLEKFVKPTKLTYFKYQLMPKFIKSKYNKLRKLYVKWHATKSHLHNLNYKNCKREYRKLLRNWQRKQETLLCQRGNRKLLYNYIRSRAKPRVSSEISSIVTKIGIIERSPSKITNLFNQYFASVLNPNTMHLNRASPNQTPQCKSYKIDAGSIQSAISRSKNTSACGLDNIPMIFWKQLSSVIAAPLAHLFNMF